MFKFKMLVSTSNTQAEQAQDITDPVRALWEVSLMLAFSRSFLIQNELSQIPRVENVEYVTNFHRRIMIGHCGVKISNLFTSNKFKSFSPEVPETAVLQNGHLAFRSLARMDL
jgi:hypothetical protein